MNADNSASPNPSAGSISNDSSGINPTASAGTTPAASLHLLLGVISPAALVYHPNPTASAGSHPSNPSPRKF
ncbi:hypothetical protein SLEP1_g37259 [Rubroshorea leprosula]|uniref:Uncharacterized protein n=1 Tax=Rubroshorea leprosula TaxID=152421 RepID=A0AAV5KUL9_9ROSI|nr:hypothetical protein SLEP1_g37259 [Rubroshorea leprosula]